MNFMINVYTVTCLLICAWTGIGGSKVLLISMDGFRWDYINQVPTPNFDAFAAKGTRADYINNTFVTKTFPCHYTIATGLYEETHGIIANKMYDPVFNETFSLKSKETKWWDGGEPLWVTARMQNLKSAIYFWPGSESEIRGYRPNIFLAYNESIKFETRVDTVVDWLSNSSYDIDLALLYFHEPDYTGHNFGPNSAEVKKTVADMDKLVGYIVDKFDKASLWDTVNVLITSDHGMTEISYPDRHIDLSMHVDMDAIDKIPVVGSTSNILPKDNKTDELIQNLTGIPHLKVYKKSDIPSGWHYQNNRRILPILAVADEGWVIVKGPKEYNDTEKGTHGYDNALSSMKPIFYARGPNIKRGYKTSPFNSVDIYPLVCELLGIKPSPNNGTLDNTRNFIVYRTSGSAMPGSSCEEKCNYNKKLTLKKYCQCDFAVKAEVVAKQEVGDWIKITINNLNVFKTSQDILFNMPGSTFLWVSKQELKCKCPRLKLEGNYLLVGKINKHKHRPGFVLDRDTVLLAWRTKMQRRFRKFMKLEARGQCEHVRS